MSEYTTSTTKIAKSTVSSLVERGIAKKWTNPRTGRVRFYINLDGMAEIIGLDATYYKSGSCSGCSYIALDGKLVSVAHSRGWSVHYSKVYIEGGTVYSSWNPYGENIAELVAVRANELCGIDPDGGEGEELYRVTCGDDACMAYDFETAELAAAKAGELNAKWPDRGYRVAHVRVGARTGRAVEIR